MVVCGTGHRPDKLGGYGNKAAENRLSSMSERWLWAEKPSLVISGGALGWDQVLASAAYVEDIPYELYLPFEDFDSKWPDGSRRVLAGQMKRASRVIFICEPGYAPWKMQKRNEAMVDAADLVLALWNGTSGGTANCIRYAEKAGKPIVNLWDEFESALR